MNYNIVMWAFNRASEIYLIANLAQTTGDYTTLNERGGVNRVEQLLQQYVTYKADYIQSFETEFEQCYKMTQGSFLAKEMAALSHIKEIKGL